MSTFNSSENQEQLMRYFAEFDHACALVGAGTGLDFIEEESTKEACIILCGMVVNARLGYALMRNNEHARKEKAENEMLGKLDEGLS